jgi:putative DNA primase/helicase
MGSMLNVARRYYDLGLTPIPCEPRSKKPACEWAQWQHRRPSWEELEQVWHDAINRFGENLNIATILGEAHGLCAIDVDDPEAFRIARIFNKFPDEDLETWITLSHRGGALIFRYPNGYDLPSKAPNEFWGAELLGNKRILVLPPSIHPSGTPYRWAQGYSPDQTPLADLPIHLLSIFIGDQLLKQMTHSVTRPQNDYGNSNGLPAWARSVVALLKPHWQEGWRHDAALSLTGTLAKRGVPKEVAESILRELVREANDPEVKDRLRALMDTYDRLAEGESVLAWQGLERVLDEDTLKALDRLLPEPPRNGQRPTLATADQPDALDQALTDRNLAKLFAQLVKDQVFYVPEWGWLRYETGRWRRASDAEIAALAMEVIPRYYTEQALNAPPERRREFLEYALKCHSRHRLNNALELAKGLLLARPDEFDRYPYLLNCLNGVVDLRTGNLLPHDPSLRLTQLCPVAYNPDATAPTWQRFLSDVFLGDQDLISFVQRALGYSLTGDTSERVFFIAWGSGHNGKSTLFGTIQRLLGDYAKTVTTDALLKRREQADTHPTGLADLYGVRLAVASETEEGKHLATARVKALTGRDRIKARYMRRDYFEFEPTAKIWLFTNHRPVISDTTPAMWKRLILIPFRAHFDPDSPQCDKRMPEKLWAEREGILAWLVQGCLAWQREGLNPPPVVREATKEYQSEMDKIGAWITERCEVDPKAVTPFADLYADYEAWCREQGDEPMSKRRFGDRLSEKGFPPATQRLSGGAKARKGLRLRPHPPQNPDDPSLIPNEPSDPSDRSDPSSDITPINSEKVSEISEIRSLRSLGHSPLVTPENPPIACHRDEKVSIPPSPCCGEPIEPDEEGIGVCVGCGRCWQWEGTSWRPADLPEGDPPTDPADPPTQPNQPDADFVVTEVWIDQWASDPPPAHPTVDDLETGEGIPVADLPPLSTQEAVCLHCGHREHAIPTGLLPPLCPACRSPMQWASDPPPTDPDPLSLALERLADLSDQLSDAEKEGGQP